MTTYTTKPIYIDDSVPPPTALPEGATGEEKRQAYSAWRLRHWELNVRPLTPEHEAKKGRPR